MVHGARSVEIDGKTAVFQVYPASLSGPEPGCGPLHPTQVSHLPFSADTILADTLQLSSSHP